MTKNRKVWMLVCMTFGIIGCKQSATTEDGLIVVDATHCYPEKELIVQDFMEVEYLPLETTDEFLHTGYVRAVGEKYIVVSEYNEGAIFLHDRHTGKGLKKICHKGEGPEDYLYPGEVLLDEKAGELYVGTSRKMCVYDLDGKFKRSFNSPEGVTCGYLLACGEGHLISHDSNGVMEKDGEKNEGCAFYHIRSKQDGSLTDSISLPYETVKAPLMKMGNMVSMTYIRTLTPCGDDVLISDTSTDTIYCYDCKDASLTPFMVNPAASEPYGYLTVGTLTDRYYFLEVVKKTFDEKTGRGFPCSDLVYDRQEKAVFAPVVLNADFTEKQTVSLTRLPFNGEVATCQTLEAFKLIEANEAGKLKGKLKEIAATLNEDDNPVLMLMKCK